MKKDSLIYVAGHRGLAGSAMVRRLKEAGYNNLLLRTSTELNLMDAAATEDFFGQHRPQYVFMCAGTVGGIMANISHPVEFTQNNILMAVSVLSAAHKTGVKKLAYLGSSCIYPRESAQPIKEEYLLTGPLEPTNEGYALAKIIGVKLCSYYRRQYGCDFISAMPSNLYGPGDNYDLQNSHVAAALIRRFHEAKENKTPLVQVWGTGKAARELTYTDDYADGVLFAMLHYQGEAPLNIGVGEDISITDLAQLIAKIVGYEGKIQFDASKPDGMLRKLMDSSRIFALGWKPSTSLKEGLQKSYTDFLGRLKTGNLSTHKF